MKRICVMIFASMLTEICLGQINLVPNPSFEDTVFGAPCYGPIEIIKNWFNPQGATPDLYTFFPGYCTGVSSMNNPNGYQLPRSGNAYAGIYGFLAPTREYIAVKLDDTLKSGKCYSLEFYVSLANPSRYAIENLGCYFTSDTAGYKSLTTNIPVFPQIINQVGHLLSDTLNWQKVSGNYTALGGEIFIIIGNFFDDQNTLVDTVFLTNTWQAAYYYIDDVQLTTCDSLNNISSANFKLNSIIYPNPSSDFIYLNNSKFLLKYEELKIFDIHGRKITSWVSEIVLFDRLKINTSKLTNGIYFLSIPNKQNENNIYLKFIKQ